MSQSYDIEKQTAVITVDDNFETGSVRDNNSNVLKRFVDKWASKLNAEARGIERVPEEEQTDTSIWTAASMWFGCNMVVATFALGTLGITVFGLSFWPAFLCIVFFNILGSQTVAFFSTFGPYFGLRQMVLSRFWFGEYPVKICIFFNTIACIGWSAVNVIVSAQMLHTVNNGVLPDWAGVLIVTFLTLVITFFGYKVVHAFEKWSWVPTVIIFLIIAIRMGKSGAFTYGTMGSGSTEAGNVLSFGATIYGYATGWTSLASDYTVYMNKRVPRPKIYLAVLGGLNFPLILAMTLGAACATGTVSTPSFAENYEKNSIGGLFFSILVDNSLHGFGQFCVVLLALSTVSNNTPNIYSFGLSIQSLWKKFKLVPRIVWTVVAAGTSLAISIPGYIYFEVIIDNFMNLIGYWLAIYTAISLSEHFFYKKGFLGYDPDAYDDPSLLPIGLAAAFAFACGIAGAILGMNQIWWQGPLAGKIGKFGGDIGSILGFSFAFVAFNLTRKFELNRFGR
jgi:NCS1 nucleoside transporter family